MIDPVADNLSTPDVLHGRREIDALYTPLDEAVAELHKRRQDARLLQRVVDYNQELPPTFLPAEPVGVLFRHIQTPNHEFEVFCAGIRQAALRPLCLEYAQDNFYSWNQDKHRLCQPVFCLAPNHLNHLRLVNFKGIEKCPMNSIKAKNGLLLTDYHHALLEHAKPDSAHYITDVSQWFFDASRGDYYYLRFLALFICHGILFENFVAADESERRFTREKVIPSFGKAMELFGVRPLIVPMMPVETEDSDHWRCHPGALWNFARELLHSKP